MTIWRIFESVIFVVLLTIIMMVAITVRAAVNVKQLPSAPSDSNRVQCPSFDEQCMCYKFEDDLFLECPGPTAVSLHSTLQLISTPIQSLSVYDFDRSVTSLTPDIFIAGAQIRHLQFSHSHLQTLKDNSLENLRASLESLSIVNGKLSQVPQKALNGMQKLMMLNFESNEITNLNDYSFHELRLVKLNMKGNQLEMISDSAFAGLEESMGEIDLSENKIKIFPMSALKKLDYLRSLRLAFNEISSTSPLHSAAAAIIPQSASSGNDAVAAATVTASATAGFYVPRFRSLIFLDLNSNQFEEIRDNTFQSFPVLKTLSLYSNKIEHVQRMSFATLRELQSLDLSHNKIIALEPATFELNRKLQTLDLSHNHVHYVSGLFANLPALQEVYVSENNVLNLPYDAFTNSTNIKVIYLEDNAIQRIDATVFHSLVNLEQLYLSSNFIRWLPRSLFQRSIKLTSLSLNGNEIAALEPGTFQQMHLLREIRLQNNRIESIGRDVFHPLPELLELHLQHNRIGRIDAGAMKSLTALQHINLQDNQLVEFDAIFATNMSALLSVQLDTNRIRMVHSKSFAGLKAAQIMWLGHNRLNKLDRTMFRDMAMVERIYLCNNSITTIQPETFQAMKVLAFLDLSSNKLRVIKKDFFSNLNELEELNLSQNEISDIQIDSFVNLKRLRSLDLSNNLLITLAASMFGGLPLTTLSLANCSLARIEQGALQSLSNLNDLNMEHNRLTLADIGRLSMATVRTLRVSENNFSASAGDHVFDGFPSLQLLYMDRCDVQHLPENVFRRNINLVKIDLSGNRLKVINRNCFNGLNVFKELRLDDNLLTDFPHIALYNISTLESLSLHGNALQSVDFFKLNGMPYLRTLRLGHNAIASLSGFNAVNLTQLDSIDLSENHLVALPGNFLQNSITLQRLDLSSNRFRQIPSQALSDTALPRLGWLNVTGNPLDRIYGTSDEHYGLMREIHISHTNLTLLTSKDFEAFTALQHLYLVQNRINRISPSAFVSLRHLLTLDLAINELEILPKERLQGLQQLQLLNVSHNNLKELEEFSTDLARLQVLDVSYNQLHRIGKLYFTSLLELRELHLMGNRISTISSDAFRGLRLVLLLDLRRNYFEDVSLKALKTLETNIKTLRLEDNPLHCSCEAQELWEWLRDHPKWLPSDVGHHLRCEQPPELRGNIFTDMEPQKFCDQPLILKLAIQDIQPYSVLVSWQSREYPGLNGYRVTYEVTNYEEHQQLGRLSVRLNHLAHSAKLIKLSANTRYRICVMGQSNWISSLSPVSSSTDGDNQPPQYTGGMALSSLAAPALGGGGGGGGNLFNHPESGYVATESGGDAIEMIDSATTRCTEVRTLDAAPSHIIDEHGMSSRGIIHSFLTRRLGLIVGCCMGIIVFIVLISVLGWLKLKKRRIENAKRQQVPGLNGCGGGGVGGGGGAAPPEYISYRHFSIPHDESAAIRDGTCNHQPAFISGTVMGTTTINC